MPFTSAFGSSVRECSLSVHEYHWSIGGRTGRHTSFGTRGSQVQILPLRPIFLQCDQAPLKRVVAVSSATGTVIGTETISHIRAGRCAHSSASGLANGRAGLLTSPALAVPTRPRPPAEAKYATRGVRRTFYRLLFLDGDRIFRSCSQFGSLASSFTSAWLVAARARHPFGRELAHDQEI